MHTPEHCRRQRKRKQPTTRHGTGLTEVELPEGAAPDLLPELELPPDHLLHPASQTSATLHPPPELPTDRSSARAPAPSTPRSQPRASSSPADRPHCPGTAGLDRTAPKATAEPTSPRAEWRRGNRRRRNARVESTSRRGRRRSRSRGEGRPASGPGDSRGRDPGRGGSSSGLN